MCSYIYDNGLENYENARVPSHSIARFQQAAPAAISILLKLMLDPNTPAASRERAAYHVLVQAGKAIEIEDIEARVSQLEETRKQQSQY